MPRISKSELLKLQKTLRRDEAIGKKYGITRQAVHQIRTLYGIPSVAAQNPKRNKEVLALKKAGKSTAYIAKKYNLCLSYTHRIIAEGKKKTRRKIWRSK